MKQQFKVSHLQFIVQSFCLPTQNLFIAGNIQTLGKWSPKKAFKLFQDEQNQNIWKSLQPVQIKLQEKIEFKLIKLDDQNNVQWETLFQNRKYHNLYPQGKALKFKQGDPNMQISSVQLKIITYRRNFFDILDDLESETTESFNFQSNYQIQSYFKQQLKSCNKKLVSISNIVIDQDKNQTIGKIDSKKKHNQNTDIIQKEKQNLKYDQFYQDRIIQAKSNNSEIGSNSFVQKLVSIMNISHSQQEQEEDWIQSWQKQAQCSKNKIRSPLASKKTIVSSISKTLKQLLTNKRIL